MTDTLNKIKWRKNAQLISSFDFSAPCSDINHEKPIFFFSLGRSTSVLREVHESVLSLQILELHELMVRRIIGLYLTMLS